MTDIHGARLGALEFVRREAGFAQVVTLDKDGFPVGRSMTAFLNQDWSVHLVQRRVHARNSQLRKNPRVLVVWVGAPATGATNERPHVFDIGRLPPRAVFVRGIAVFMAPEWTVDVYMRQIHEQRRHGFRRAPLRGEQDVNSELIGLRVLPHRVRLEGFGEGAQSFDWTVEPAREQI